MMVNDSTKVSISQSSSDPGIIRIDYSNVSFEAWSEYGDKIQDKNAPRIDISLRLKPEEFTAQFRLMRFFMEDATKGKEF